MVCRRCGISRPTLRKWWRRFQSEGEAGLIEKSRRPHRFAAQKVFAAQEAIILALRRERRLRRKGIWVGGPMPLDYRSLDKKLESVPEEADLVPRSLRATLTAGVVRPNASRSASRA